MFCKKRKSRYGCEVEAVSFEDKRLQGVLFAFQKHADQRNDKVQNFEWDIECWRQMKGQT